MENGKLVPDDIVIGAIKERLEQDDVKQNGFLFISKQDKVTG